MTTFAQAVQNTTLNIVTETEKELAIKLAKAKSEAAQKALLQVLCEKVSRNPDYTLGDLLDELKHARATRKNLCEIPLHDLAKALMDFGKVTNVPSVTERFLPLFEKDPTRSWTRADLQRTLGCTAQYITNLISHHISIGTISRDGANYRLNLQPAREAILGFFPSKKDYFTREEILQGVQGVQFAEIAFDILVKNGFVARYENGKYGKK